MNAQQPQTRDLDLWFVNKDTDGAEADKRARSTSSLTTSPGIDHRR